MTDVPSTTGAGGTATDLHNEATTDGIFRGLAMLENPMDGILHWDVSNV